MATVEVARTLVKSPPELWSELENAERLGALLGEIEITRVDEGSAIEWESAAERGTIAIEQSGWGTRVRLSAEPREPQPQPQPHAAADAAAAADGGGVESEDGEPAHQRRRSLLARLFGRRRTEPEAEPGAVPDEATTPPAPEPDAQAAATAVEQRLTAVLDHLGAAHKRPFTAA
jgi:hypothetical protein